MTLTVMSLAGTSVSTGLVLNRRSVSAEKYWIGPIHFWLDRAFSIILSTGAPGQSTPLAVPHSHTPPQQYSETRH